MPGFYSWNLKQISSSAVKIVTESAPTCTYNVLSTYKKYC